MCSEGIILQITLPQQSQQSRARYSQFSWSPAFWCSCFPLGYQYLNYEWLVSFPLSRCLFIKSWSCLVFSNSFENLDILDQILVNIINFRNFSKPRKIHWVQLELQTYKAVFGSKNPIFPSVYCDNSFSIPDISSFRILNLVSWF